MACVATVQVGPARQAFWAVLSRGEGRRLRERTHTLGGRGAVELTPGRLRVSDRGTAIDPSRPQISDRGTAIDPSRPQMRDGGVAIPGRLRVRDVGVAIDLALQEDAGIEALCPHGRGYVWTRKQAGIPARGTVALDGGPTRKIEALAVVDDTAGYHARVTEWRWAAGVGVDPAGTPLAFNLVEGVNDPPNRQRARGVGGGRAARGGRRPLRGRPVADRVRPTARSCASPPRRSAAAARTCCWCAATTARRSGPSPARLPAGSSWRTAWAWWSTTARGGRPKTTDWRRSRRRSGQPASTGSFGRLPCRSSTPGTWRPAPPWRRGGRGLRPRLTPAARRSPRRSSRRRRAPPRCARPARGPGGGRARRGCAPA